MSDEQQEMLIVTGMSGAGRSTVADALEDLDWYVVDNLPPQMLRPLVDLIGRAGASLPKIAAVVDIRGRDFFTELQDILKALRATTEVRVMFLDADDSVLVRRFEAVRRPHPLQGEGTILDGIQAERARLAEIRETSDILVDTSHLNIHQLAILVADKFEGEGAAALTLTIMSFGFKYGLPPDADLVVDARFLPNPFWVPELKPLSGENQRVADYVLAQPGAETFVTRFLAALEPVLSGYQNENKRHATIAVGCTGGKHRSVVIARELAAQLDQRNDLALNVKHRDLGRE